MKLYKWLRHYWWQLGLLLVAGIVLVWAGLYFSMKSYFISLNRQEVMIAKVSAASFTNDPVKMTESGTLRVYYYMAGGVTDRLVKVKVGSQTAEKVMEMETYWDTGFEVKAGDEVKVSLFEGKNYAVEASGWVEPNSDETCGLGSYRKEPLERLKAFLEDDGVEYEKIMCWTDNELPKGLTMDFNDFQVVVAYTPGSSGGGTNVDNGNDSNSKAKFLIRSFRDSNQNGVWDGDESPLGLKVYYDYQVNDGGWSGYSTDGETGWGETIEVKDGDRVGIRRKELAGWESKMGFDVTGEVDGGGTTYFDFGYYPAGEVVSSNQTSSGYGFVTQPGTGAPTWLTVSAALGLVGLLVVKLKIL